MCRFLKKNFLGLQKCLSQTHSPLFFAARNYGDLFSWHWNPGLGLLTPEISLLNFYPPYVGERLAHFTSVLLLPVFMDMVSLIQ